MFNFKGILRSISARPQPALDDSEHHVESQLPPRPLHVDVEPLASTIQSKKFSERVLLFEKCLKPSIILLSCVRDLAFQGIPDKPGLRSTYWKILLGFLPVQKQQWAGHLRKQREDYHDFVLELVVNPYKKFGQEEPSKSSHFEDVDCADDPLSSAHDSQWAEYFRDNELREEIDKDVARTRSGMHFFQQHINYAEMASPSMLRDAQTLSDETKNHNETHHDVLTRILFVYAKLNPGIRYVQGMNEILAPLYYVFARDPDPSFRLHAEADAFFCFTNLMAEIKDRFMQSLDGSDSGIVACIEAFKNVLRRADPKLFLHLESNQVSAHFYSLRWLTLLLSQEFTLPEVLQLWDSLLADRSRFDFLNYVCCSLLIDIRMKLLGCSYAEMLQTLQRYPPTDISRILRSAVAIRTKMTKRAPRSPR